MNTKSKVYVIGVGMTKFEKPGSRENFDYPDMAREAGSKALKDAGINYDQIEQAFVGYVYGDSTSGQRAVYELGLTGIPIVNVNNNCSTGSTALLLAKNLIEGKLANCVLALGFEKMQRGSLSSQYSDRENPIEKHVGIMSNMYDIAASPMTAQMFGNAGKDYVKKHNLNENECRSLFAKIAYKNHKHSTNNPYAQFQKEYSLDEIMNSPMIHDPLTKLQCSPTSDGSAAAVLASEEFVKKHGLESKAVEIMALEMATDLPSTFNEKDCTKLVGFDMSKLAAIKAFEKSKITPNDVQVVELHDCFSCNELITYEALGLCQPGKAFDLVRNNDNTYGGKYVINPSGGLISKGHPLGATGIAQCAELCWQLRGEAGKRQVKNVKYALQHNIGLGGAAIVGIYKLACDRSSNTASNAVNSSASTNSSLSASTQSHKSGKFFEEIDAKLKAEGKQLVDKVKAVIGFQVECANGKSINYIVDLKKDNGSVFVSDGSIKPECLIKIGDDDLLAIMDGKLNMMTAFTQKKLKISGNMSIAMKLNQLFSSLATKRTTTTPSNNTASATNSSLTTSTKTHKSGKFFDEIEAKLKVEGKQLVDKVKAIIGFQVECDGGRSITYIVDMKKDNGSVFVSSGSDKPECLIKIGDADLLAIMDGKLNMMTAFTQKKLKISGNMSIAMKLNQLFSSLAAKQKSKL